MHSSQTTHRRRQNNILWDRCRLITHFIYKGCELPGLQNKRVRAIFFLVLEAISFLLDQFGRSNRGFLLAAFLLSVLGFAITIYTNCTKKLHTSIVTRTEAERQLLAVEIVFSLVQLIATFIHFVLDILGVKSNYYSACVFPLAFAAIAVVLVCKKHEEAIDLPQDRHINISSGDHSNIAGNSAMPLSHLRQRSFITPSDNGVDQNGYPLPEIERLGDNTQGDTELPLGQDRISNNEGGGFKGTLKILKGDITHWFKDRSSDAIVNPANVVMLGGGGCDGAIHWAAGPKLMEACYKVPEVRPGVRCPVGEARITPGFELPASHVIHTVGPFYDVSNRQALLRNAYKNCLSVAKENKIQYIAFPAISCGLHGYPLEEAATVALSTIKEFGSDLKETIRLEYPMIDFYFNKVIGLNEIYFVLFLDNVYNVWLNKAKELFGA